MSEEFFGAIKNLLRRVSSTKIDDTGTQQRVEMTGLKGEAFKNVVRLQPYGFSSVPPKGSEGVLLTQGGRSDRAHVLGLEHKDYRPVKRKDGEVVFYDLNGQEVYISKDGIKIIGGKKKLPLSITIGSSVLTVADGKITLKADKIVADGTVYLGGADASKEASMRGTVDSAGHTEQSNLATKVWVK